MAAASNVQKYMINNVEIPVYPTSVAPSDNLISKSWNNMYGEFVDIPVNLKMKINWVFDCISETDLNTLYGTMIRNVILTSKSRFFTVNSYFPGVGYIIGTFYLGAPVSFTSLGSGVKGKPNYWKVEIHWIEVDGIKLNDPAQSVVTLNQQVNINNRLVQLNENDEQLNLSEK